MQICNFLLFFVLIFSFFKIPKSLTKALDKSLQKSQFKKIQNRTRGTKVIRIQVHAESAAIVALRAAMVTEFSSDLNALKTVMNFFGGIFDMVNEEIGDLGVQVRGDFSKLLIDHMPWDKTKCVEGDPLRARTNIANSIFSMQSPAFGTKIALLFCPERVLMPSKSVNQGTSCNNITGVMFGELRSLKEAVMDATYKIVSGGHPKPLNNPSNFERGTAKFAADCIGTLDKSENGEFVSDLKAVRHLATERYILEDGKKLKEHDLMDDIYLLKSGQKRMAGYPTEDYSNDDELYTDINE